MYGKKVKLRVLFLIAIISSIILTIFLILKSLEENVLYFISPSEVKTFSEIKKEKIRLGGMVKENSIKINNNIISFIITDFDSEIKVSYSGLVPNLFSDIITLPSSPTNFFWTASCIEFNIS